MEHRTWSIKGKVLKGEGYGRKIGFPTANIDRRSFSRLKQKPKEGVWAGIVRLTTDNLQLTTYRAGIVIGPKDSSGRLKLEAYLIGFKGNLYGRELEFILVKYLRPFTKFTGEAELKNQINKDIKNIKQLKWKN